MAPHPPKQPDPNELLDPKDLTVKGVRKSFSKNWRSQIWHVDGRLLKAGKRKYKSEKIAIEQGKRVLALILAQQREELERKYPNYVSSRDRKDVLEEE